MDLSSGFKNPFQVGNSHVHEPGYYALAYSCTSVSNEMSHPTSLLLEYNELQVHEEGEFVGQLQLCIFNVESIESPCIAAPYSVKDNVMNAIKWSIMRPRNLWNSILIKFLKDGYESNKEM